MGKPYTKEKMIRFNLYLPRDDIEKAKQIAKETGLYTVASLIRVLLKEKIREFSEQPKE